MIRPKENLISIKTAEEILRDFFLVVLLPNLKGIA